MRFALSRLLVPQPSTTPPDGWTVPPTDIDGSLPMTLDLGNGVKARIVYPAGLGRDVSEMPANDLASDSTYQWETYPRTPAGERLDPFTPRPKLIIRDSNGVLGTLPFVSGHAFGFGWWQANGVEVQIELLSWRIAVGNLRENGRFGSQLALAFRRADKGSASFEPPPVHPYVAMRDQFQIVVLSIMQLIQEMPRPTRGLLRRRIK